MNGLIKKDYLTIKKKYGIGRLALDAVIIVTMLIMFKSMAAFLVGIILIPIEVNSMIITLATCDEQWKWGRYAISLPVSKKQIVASRYLFVAAIVAAGFVISVAVNFGTFFMYHQYPIQLHIMAAQFSLMIMLLFMSLILPSNYFIGVNAGFVVMLVLMMVSLVVGFIFYKSGVNITVFLVDNLSFIKIAAGLIVAAFCYLSFLLSVSFFKRKYR